MTREQLERAKVIVSCIDQATNNIAMFEEIQSAKEIRIQNDAHSKPIFIGGKNEDMIMDLLINEQKIYRNKQQAELEKI